MGPDHQRFCTSPNHYKLVRARRSLYKAWRHVRDNGLHSPSNETRNAILEFDQEAPRNLERIGRQLARHGFRFEPQTGYVQKKGKKKRPIVIAAVKNRVVQRSMLDVLQDD
jgi:hypothetical protein